MKQIAAFLGDAYHKQEDYLAFIQKVLMKEEGVQVRDYSLKELSQALLEKPDLVIFSLENRLTPNEEEKNCWLTPLLEEQIITYVKNGGNWLAWHSGMSNYPINSKYIGMLKGYFVSHPEIVEVSYRKKNEEKFSFLDEHYFTKVEEKKTDVFIRSFSNYGESIASWRHSFGAGKVLCYTPCHTKEGFESTTNQEEFFQAMNWCLEKTIQKNF